MVGKWVAELSVSAARSGFSCLVGNLLDRCGAYKLTGNRECAADSDEEE